MPGSRERRRLHDIKSSIKEVVGLEKFEITSTLYISVYIH